MFRHSGPLTNLPQKLLAQIGIIKDALDAPNDCGVPVRPVSLVRKNALQLNAILNSN
jgi:hypothetical protein